MPFKAAFSALSRLRQTIFAGKFGALSIPTRDVKEQRCSHTASKRWERPRALSTGERLHELHKMFHERDAVADAFAVMNGIGLRGAAETGGARQRKAWNATLRHKRHPYSRRLSYLQQIDSGGTMSTSEERIAALEFEVQNLRQHLLTFMETSATAAEVQTSLIAENLLLSRAVTFLGIVWGQDPGLPAGLLKDVYSMTMEGVDEDIKALAQRATTNLRFWNR